MAAVGVSVLSGILICPLLSSRGRFNDRFRAACGLSDVSASQTDGDRPAVLFGCWFLMHLN